MNGLKLVVFLVWVLGVVGWIMNIYGTVLLLWVDGPITVTGMMVLRVVGIFIAPLGAVLGYF